MTDAADTQAPGATTRVYHYPTEASALVSITIDDSRDALLTEFGKATLRDRYLLPGESYQDLFARVACANSDEVVRGEKTGHAQVMYDAISRLYFMPATPILSNSGTKRGLTISCFLNRIGDSMTSIAQGVHENIWLAAMGGGIGTFWGDVRSIDEPIGGSITGTTSGIVPFVRWQDAQTEAISQGSLRRGSAAVYLDLAHPEIEEFIDIRRHQGGDQRRKAHNIHHGVMVPDAFMDKVWLETQEERVWELKSPKTGAVIKTVDARALFIKLVTARLELGEPYIVFSDRVNSMLPEIQKVLGLKVVQSNLCSEITLPTGEDHLGNWRTAVCCLSSMNMETWDQWRGEKKLVLNVLRFLDNVLTEFIAQTAGMVGFERARYSAMRERSVGLGMMGFHSYLQSKEIPFESVAAEKENMSFWEFMKAEADEADEQLVRERGENPDSADARQLDPSVKPRRLTNRFSIAPTASISIICGGASACGEPIPANSYTQKTLSGSFNVRNKYLDAQLRRRYHQLRDSLAAANKTVAVLLREQPMFRGVEEQSEQEWVEAQWASITVNDGSVQHLAYFCRLEKANYKTAFEIDQRWVVKHHAMRTPFICQSQSLNIYLPSTVHKKDLVEIHRYAYEQGVKSLYYLRSKSASKAMAIGNQAGEMPQAHIEAAPAGPVYIDEPVCESCQ
ncbi:ribonucleoside-diphosphate reductase alpha chain [Sphingomonas sp. NFR04]|uniref:ribonucleoside-diphosphate reductase subunit alpha n=1 Tax=Sphingomonas sp. NFR04 TaxID=1566283 RepID=UPI0008E5E477|nr:ribonucleoside-diphosphate reductase subunit alpha [Sphingomonas sp. NFR04]SFJ49497.1 ribonucleoside-diphosphate reductase alpha chain [Sphingomonas sp. NFR04]